MGDEYEIACERVHLGDNLNILFHFLRNLNKRTQYPKGSCLAFNTFIKVNQMAWHWLVSWLSNEHSAYCSYRQQTVTEENEHHQSMAAKESECKKKKREESDNENDNRNGKR